jgi:hypothetical protein
VLKAAVYRAARAEVKACDVDFQDGPGDLDEVFGVFGVMRSESGSATAELGASEAQAKMLLTILESHPPSSPMAARVGAAKCFIRVSSNPYPKAAECLCYVFVVGRPRWPWKVYLLPGWFTRCGSTQHMVFLRCHGVADNHGSH